MADKKIIWRKRESLRNKIATKRRAPAGAMIVLAHQLRVSPQRWYLKGTEGIFVTAWHIIVRYKARPGREVDVREKLAEFVAAARNEEGCLYYELFESREVEGEFHTLDGWSNESALRAHRIHPNVTQLSARIASELDVPPVVIRNKKLT
jgi:quinol monooxygenase YgiN